MRYVETLGTCDPFALADDLVKRMKRLQEQASKLLKGELGAGLPESLGDLLECLTVGTADRASIPVDTSYNPYDPKQLQARVNLIFSNVSNSARTTADRLIPGTSFGYSYQMSGLWMSKDVANTFHGLVAAQTHRSNASARHLVAMTRYSQRLLLQMEAAINEIDAATLEGVADETNRAKEEISPELCAIAADLLSMVESLRATRDLASASCGATSLQERIAALLRKLPSRSPKVAKVLALAEQLNDLSRPMQDAYEVVRSTQEMIPGFADQIEASSSVTDTEAALYEVLAAEFDRLCKDMTYAVEEQKVEATQRLFPETYEICLIAIETLQAHPSERVNRVKTHSAYPFYQQHADRLRDIDPPFGPFQVMADFQLRLAGSVLGWNGEVRSAIGEIQSRIGAIDSFGVQVESAGKEFLGAIQNEVDQLCVGALRRLLATSGYDALARKFLYGLFGEIPNLLQETMTTAGQLSKCLSELGGGNIAELPGPQRFAVERLNDAVDGLKQASNFIAETRQSIEGFLDDPSSQIAALQKSIRSDASALLGLESDTQPTKTPNTAEAIAPELSGVAMIGNAKVQISPDGWVSWIEGDLPPSLAMDANNLIRIRPGYAKSTCPDGYEPGYGNYLRPLAKAKVSGATDGTEFPSALYDMERIRVPTPKSATVVPIR